MAYEVDKGFYKKRNRALVLRKSEACDTGKSLINGMNGNLGDAMGEEDAASIFIAHAKNGCRQCRDLFQDVQDGLEAVSS